MRLPGPFVPDGYSDPVPVSGYANTYYPGSQALRGARVVVVRSGRDSKRVNFTLAPCRLARLAIHGVDSRGVPLGPNAQMTLTRRDDAGLASSTPHTSRRNDETFLFDGIQPGDYYLVAATSYQMEEAAYVNVSIHEADVSLNVQTNTGARVSGRILVDGRPAAGNGSPSANVSVSSNPPPGWTGPTAQWQRGYRRYARTTGASTQLIRVPPGRYLIAAIRDIGINHPAEVGMLEQLRPLAVPVTVVAGQTAKVTLGVANATR
jgi:hypothetical protein